jgi:hypothetical protein
VFLAPLFPELSLEGGGTLLGNVMFLACPVMLVVSYRALRMEPLCYLA